VLSISSARDRRKGGTERVKLAGAALEHYLEQGPTDNLRQSRDEQHGARQEVHGLGQEVQKGRELLDL
jgi:hypothetical protein